MTSDAEALDFKATALALAEQGLRVFPVTPNAKKPPLLKSWEKRASTEAQAIERWWGKTPEANVGIHCANLLVVDIDADKNGLASIKEQIAEHGPLPETLEVATPSGGRHLYYKADGGVRNRVDLWPGVDIRSNNGYVIAPGCVVPKGTYRVRTDAPVAQAPEWLLDACRRDLSRLEPGEGAEDVDPRLACQRAREWLSRAPAATEGQGGDHRTFAVACRVRDFGVPEDQAIDVLHAWNQRCEPPWDLEELRRKVHNAYRYAENPPGVDSAEAWFEPVESAEPAPPPFEPDPELYSPDDIRLAEILATNYLAKGWVEAQSHALLFGPWGAGKTFLSLNLAAHIAAGQEWFGARVRQAGVLYFGYEGVLSLRRRLYALRQENPDWDLSRFRIRPMRWPLAKRDSDAKLRGHEALESALKTFRGETGAYPGLIIVDPLRDALGGPDSDPDLTAPYLSLMKRLIMNVGCTVLTVHHPGHADDSRARGDSAIEAHMDTVIRMDSGRGVIETRKQRDSADLEAFYRLKVVDLGLDDDGDRRTSCVVEKVEQNPLDPALTDTQRSVLHRLKDLAGPEMSITKGVYNSVVSGYAKETQVEVWSALIQKGYLAKDGKEWRFGAGAAELFSDDVEEGEG